MKIRMILGAAGSGKSTALLRQAVKAAAANPGRRYFCLVPEQFTLETQRRLVKEHPRGAMLNMEAVSFAHLADRVFRETGEDKKNLLEEPARHLMIALALQDVSADLRVYQRAAGKAWFTERLASLFAEWDMNAVGPERLRELAVDASLTPLLQKKLTELALIREAFMKRLGENNVTKESLHPRLAALLPKSGAYSGAEFFVDGFTGFTAAQYRILEELMSRCSGITFTVVLPQDVNPWSRAGAADVFAMSLEMIYRLQQCAERVGRETEITYADGAPARPAELAYLTENLFSHTAVPRKGPAAAVSLMQCGEPGEECDYVAADILREIQEEGLRARDLAVVVSDTETYLPLLEQRLGEAGIPYFSDRRAPVMQHPYVRMLTAALEAARRGPDRDTVLRYLKTSCSPLEAEETDRLDIYTLAVGIRLGRQWLAPFTRSIGKRGTVFDTEAMEGLRERAMAPLVPLTEAFHGTQDVSSFCTAVRAFLSVPVLAEKAEQRRTEEEAAGHYIEAEEWERLPDEIGHLLEQMEAVLGKTELSPDAFLELFDSMLRGLSIGHLPAAPDMTVLGDVKRSRFGNIRILYILGMNEGMIPSVPSSGSLLTDAERVLLAPLAPEMAYTEERSVYEERFYLYSLFAKPTEALRLCWHRVHGDGSAAAPSLLIRDIEALLPDLREHYWSRSSALTRYAGPGSVGRILASLPKDDPALEVCFRILAAEGPEGELALDQFEKGLFFRFPAHRLSEEADRALFRENISGSVSRLEDYAECPYRYFLQYGLGLNAREEMKWDPIEHGNLFHRAMELLGTEVRDRGTDLSGLSEEERRALAERLLRTALEETRDGASDRIPQQYLLKRWQQNLERIIWAMGEWHRGPHFRTDASELSFSAENDPYFRISLSDGRSLRLYGKIDRVDVSQQDDKLYLRVVDYKTKSKAVLDDRLLVTGQDLLPLYLGAASHLYAKQYPDLEVIPAGLYYASLHEPILKGEGSALKDPEKALLQEMRLSGRSLREVSFVTPDAAQGKNERSELQFLTDHAHRKAAALADAILDGKIQASPAGGEGRDACAFCDYGSVCRFRSDVPGAAYSSPDSQALADFKLSAGSQAAREDGKADE